MSNRNITSASKYLKKEIERLQKEATTWKLKQAIALENYENTLIRIEKLGENLLELESQIEELEPKTQVHD